MSPKQLAFLKAFARTGNITAAAEASKVGRRSHYDWLNEPEYQTAFDAAREEAIERLETEARRRAEHGVSKIVTHRGLIVWEPLLDEHGIVVLDSNGKPVMSGRPLLEHTYSDNLLMFLLKSLRPQKYRDNAAIEHTGPGGGPLSIQVEFVPPKAA